MTMVKVSIKSRSVEVRGGEVRIGEVQKRAGAGTCEENPEPTDHEAGTGTEPGGIRVTSHLPRPSRGWGAPMGAGILILRCGLWTRLLDQSRSLRKDPTETKTLHKGTQGPLGPCALVRIWGLHLDIDHSK